MRNRLTFGFDPRGCHLELSCLFLSSHNSTASSTRQLERNFVVLWTERGWQTILNCLLSNLVKFEAALAEGKW